MTDRKPTSRRDEREAKGYLTDLFESAAPDETNVSLADYLLAHASQVKVQRATDMLVMYFDLNDEQDQPETTEA